MSKKKDDYELAKDLTKEMVSAPVAKEEEVALEDMTLNTLGDYMRYNSRARAMNKKLRICRYPIKQCPVELHPMETVVINRNDKNTMDIPVYVSDENIEFKMKLEQGKEYKLPRYIVKYLSQKGVPVWKWFNTPDGGKETRISHKDPRFSLRTVYRD